MSVNASRSQSNSQSRSKRVCRRNGCPAVNCSELCRANTCVCAPCDCPRCSDRGSLMQQAREERIRKEAERQRQAPPEPVKTPEQGALF